MWVWVWVCEGVTGENISYISFSMLKITERFIPVFSTWNTKSLDNYKHTICIYNTHTHTQRLKIKMVYQDNTIYKFSTELSFSSIEQDTSKLQIKTTETIRNQNGLFLISCPPELEV